MHLEHGEPTEAGEGFARKCGVEFDKIETTKRGNREILYYKKEDIGKRYRRATPRDDLRMGRVYGILGKSMEMGEVITF